MHLVLFFTTITIDRSYASAATPILQTSQASVANSNPSSPALSLRSATVSRSRRDLPIRVSYDRTAQTSRLSRRLSLVNNTSVIHYSNLDVTDPGTASNGTFYYNGTVVKAATASGLNAIFGTGSTTGTGATTSNSKTGTSIAGVDSPTVSGSNNVYNTLLRYAEFSAGAYESSCSSPEGSTLIQYITGETYNRDTQSMAAGFVARDDINKELIVAFRGDPTLQFFNSATFSGQISNLVDVTSATSYPFSAPAGSSVNAEMLNTYQLYAQNLSASIRAQLALHGDYGITFTGHGTGGSLASVAAVHHTVLLGSKIPVQVITYGAPRIGNAKWAAYTESLFLTDTVARYLRVTRPNDNVPQILPTSLGYQHSATELYLRDSGTSSADILQCTGSEDVTCNDSQLSTLQTTNVDTGSAISAEVGPNSASGLQGISPAPSPATTQPSFISSSTQSGTSQDSHDTTSTGSAEVAPMTPTLGSTVTSGISNIDGSVPCSVCKGTECITCTQDLVRVQNSVSGAAQRSDKDESSNSADEASTFTTSDSPTDSFSRQSTIPGSDALSDPQTVMFPIIYSLASNIAGATNISNSTIPTMALHKNSSSTLTTILRRDSNTTDISSGRLVEPSLTTQPGSVAPEIETTNLLTVTKAMAHSINAAHLTYLGINMVNDGARFCSTGSSVISSNAVVLTSNFASTSGTETKTQTVVSGGYSGSSNIVGLFCAISISIYSTLSWKATTRTR